MQARDIAAQLVNGNISVARFHIVNGPASATNVALMALAVVVELAAVLPDTDNGAPDWDRAIDTVYRCLSGSYS